MESQAVHPSSNPASATHGTALVVDDDATNRMVLKTFLKKEGFEIIEAENGEQAIERYRNGRPDIVFMDLMMPVMDGLEATRRIKSADSGNFTPVIFLTAMNEAATIVRCTEAGGDDFLNKPIDYLSLKAKIHAMERIRDMHRQISGLNNRLYQQQSLAEHIFTNIISRKNVEFEQFHYILRPAELFSGDILLTACTPSREIHLLLADFTGHGLSAALGALPISEAFHAMTAKGFAIEEILTCLNDKLKRLLPANMFMAAQYVRISSTLDEISLCNCGMPDILILDRNRTRIKSRVNSRAMPLGIEGGFDFQKAITHYQAEYGDRIILASDGILEATNAAGEQFGQSRFEQALLNATVYNEGMDKQGFENTLHIFDSFCGDTLQADDISLVEFPCLACNLPVWDIESLLGSEKEDSNTPTAHNMTREPPTDLPAELSLLMNASNLRTLDPVPLLINQISQLAGRPVPRQNLFVILTELYVNALDHGLLELDSALKNSAEGFEQYFEEREKRLASLQSGHIRIHMRIRLHEKGGQLELELEDSGSGFDVGDEEDGKNALSGRGIMLVRQLCSSVTYHSSGNRVTVIYEWDNPDRE